MVKVMLLQDKSTEFILHKKKERYIEDNSMTFEISIFLIRNRIFTKLLLQDRGVIWKNEKRSKEDLCIKQKDKDKSLIIYTRIKNALYLHKIS